MRIEDIPTEIFNQVLEDFQKSGWRRVYEYDGFDAWMDYGKVVLQREGETLTFEWDNWFEGVIEGPDLYLENLKLKRPRSDSP
jgi:hypothetical protein